MDNKNPQHKAFLRSYEDHADALFRFCYLKVRHRDSARDIVQDAFIKTWEYLANGKSIENFRAFLYRVVRNLIIDRSRQKQSVSLDKLTEDGIDFGDDSAVRLHRKLDAEHLLTCFTILGDTYQEVLVMRYVDDLAVKEIADILGQSENTVSVRIHRGIKKLQQHLSEQDL